MEEKSDSPPAGGTSSSTYVAADGSIKALLPRNVNINQFYPQVPFSNPKERQPVKLGEFVDTSPPPASQAAITDGKEAEEPTPAGEDNNTEETSDLKEQQEAISWAEEDKDKVDSEFVFSTQVDEETLEAAKERQKSGGGTDAAGSGGGTLFEPENWEVPRHTLSMEKLITNKIESHFGLADHLFHEQDYVGSINNYTKAIVLSINKDELFVCYVRRAEAFLQLADFQSCILNYKRACMIMPNHFKNYSRLAFIYYFYGQTLFDQKLFPEALEAFSRAAEMRPEVVGYHTRSIACLAALQRHGECLALVNRRLEVEQDNADMYIMRARLHRLFRNTTLCYYDVKDALSLSPHHPEALKLMAGLEVKALELKKQAQQLNLMCRHRDAMQKISLAIETNPSVADFHVLRGALHRRLGDFNAAIDDYLLALDKTDHDEESPIYQESQRQLLLTYNDFAIECFCKGFYDEAIILLNKAIKGEKDEKGLYVNRGDCFYKQGELQFALCDYHQALEMDPADKATKARVAVINNDYGLQEYNDKNYTEAEGRFSVAIQHNPYLPDYYISRARVKHILENSVSARQDLLLAMLLNPTHPEIMSMLTRLFPGKSLKDVLASPAAAKAKHALQHLVATATPVKLSPLGSESSSSISSSHNTEVDATNSESSNSVPPIAGAWRPGGGIPDLKSCMREHDFLVKVAMEKQVLNRAIKKTLTHRKPLSSPLQGVRVADLPTPSPPTTAKPKAGNKQPQSKLAVTTGWRKFTSGIGTV